MSLEYKTKLLGDSIDQLKKFLKDNSLYIDEGGLYDEIQEIINNLEIVYNKN